MPLYTFNISHFSEKARWTLDFEGFPYEEKVLLPGPHQLVTRRIARRTHVLVLEHDGQYVQGSNAIIDYVADRLGGTRLTPIDPIKRARVLELEKTLDQAFGRGVQQVLYSVLLKDRRTVIDLWSFGGPFWARGFYAVAFPVVASAVKRMYKTTDVEGVARAKQRFVTREKPIPKGHARSRRSRGRQNRAGAKIGAMADDLRRLGPTPCAFAYCTRGTLKRNPRF